MIETVIWKKGPPSKQEVVITNLRHRQALTQAIASLTSLIEGLKTGVSARIFIFRYAPDLGRIRHHHRNEYHGRYSFGDLFEILHRKIMLRNKGLNS